MSVQFERKLEIIKEEVDKILNNAFEDICIGGDILEIKKFIDEFKFNPNADDGWFVEIISRHRDVELMRQFISLGVDIHKNNEGVLRFNAHQGNIEILDFLIRECNCDYTVCYQSTAYSNNKKTKEYLDELEGEKNQYILK